MARKSGDPEEPDGSEWTIDSVKIIPEKVDLKAGESKQFTAEVKGKGEFSKEVFWEVAGNKDKRYTYR